MVNLCPRCTRLELKKEDIYINIQENEKIHPFQDENERTGRAIILKQCFDANIVPVIVSDNEKLLYYQALHMAQTEHQYGKLLEFFEKEQEKYYENVKDFVIPFKEKDQLNKDSIKVEDAGKIKRFQSFSCSMNYNSVNESVHKVFPLESDIPVITEDEFITSFMTENYFINHQVHVGGGITK